MIEQATAERLAATSDSIADRLEQGDVCAAAGLADDLLEQVTEAINAGSIPAPLQEDLSSKANELVNEVNCPEPPLVTEDDDDDDDDEGRRKGKKSKEKDEDEDPPIEIPPIETEDD